MYYLLPKLHFIPTAFHTRFPFVFSVFLYIFKLFHLFLQDHFPTINNVCLQCHTEAKWVLTMLNRSNIHKLNKPKSGSKVLNFCKYLKRNFLSSNIYRKFYFHLTFFNCHYLMHHNLEVLWGWWGKCHSSSELQKGMTSSQTRILKFLHWR